MLWDWGLFNLIWWACLTFQFDMGPSIYVDKPVQEKIYFWGNFGHLFYSLPVDIQDIPVYICMPVHIQAPFVNGYQHIGYKRLISMTFLCFTDNTTPVGA